VKTTDLFVEQVLIGALLLSAALLPWLPELAARRAGLDGIAGLLGGAIALGAAYLLGIVGDRLADTLTEGLERHHRLRFALAWPALQDRERPRTALDWVDPFPEDALRLAVLRDAAAVVAWLDYHRSRVRLTRALAVFLPAVTVAAVLGAAGSDWTAGTRWGPAPGAGWIAVVPAVYGLVIARLAALGRSSPRGKARGASAWLQAPRTHQPEAYDYGKDQGFTADDGASQRARRRTLARILARDSAVQGAALLHLAAIGLAVATGPGTVVGLAVGAAGLTALSAWSWWRISATYRHYLRQVGKHPGAGSR
jgi:hypothetical protein